MIRAARSGRRRALLAAASIGLATLSCHPRESKASASVSGPTEVGPDGGVFEGSLAPGDIRRYHVSAARGSAVVLRLDQIGIDSSLAVIAPSGERLAIDNPRKTEVPEELHWVAYAPGGVTVAVEAPVSDDPIGRYRLVVDPLRPATDEDRAAVRCFRIYQAARTAQGSGRYEDARQGFTRAGECFRRPGMERWETWAWTKAGSIADTKLRLPREAEASFRRVVDLERGLSCPRCLASGLNSLASVIARSRPGDPAAVAAFEEVRQISTRVPFDDPEVELSALEGEARARYELGDVHVALDLYDRLVERAREVGNLASACAGQIAISRVLRRAGDLVGAYRECRDCRAAARGREPTVEAQALVELASIEIGSERSRRGLSMLDEAARLDGAQRGSSRWQHDRARALGRLGRIREADSAFGSALDLAKREDERTSVRIDRAYALYQAGDHRKAMAVCDELARELGEDGDQLAVAGAHHCLARSYRALGRPVEARHEIERALELVELTRTELAQDRLRTAFLEKRRDYYGLYVQILLDQGDGAPSRAAAERAYERAFEVAEASKARTLVDGLKRDLGESNEAPETSARERELESSIGTLERERFDRRGTSQETREIDLELDRRLAELDRLRAERRARRPGWRDDLALDPTTIAEVREALLADGATQLVSFFLGEEGGAVWVVGDDSIAVGRLPPRAVVEKRAREVARLLGSARRSRDAEQALDAAQAFANVVLGPVAGALTAERLLLAKDGALFEVPFAPLPLSLPSGTVRVSDRFEIVDEPSAATAVALRKPRPWRPSSDGRIAIVADPVFRCDDERLSEAARCSESPGSAASNTGRRRFDPERLSRLAASGEEARAIARMAPGRDAIVLLGPDARAEPLLSGELSGAEILHLATHGYLELGDAGLVFARFDGEGRPIEDSFVPDRKIYELRLGADLVVLSACRTGLGAEITGEGIVGLARAFLWAGASSVVVSLWDVDDEATRFLMERFYEALLLEGRSPAAALRLAQASVREQPGWAAPRYWAGFVVQGDWD